LEQADKLLKQMVRQFQKQSSERKEPIAEMLAEVQYRQAERLYEEATYRKNKQEYAAAIVYCDRILDNYPDTPYAEMAQEIIDNAEGKPSVPTPYMHWMTYVFPTRDKVTPLLKPTEEEAAERQSLITRNRPKVPSNPLDPMSGDSQVRTAGSVEPVKR
jgi:tetratricopeptide (TPR) repeat protein